MEHTKKLIQLPEKLEQLFNDIKTAGGMAYIVGGAVRDALLEIEPKDLDIEVFKLSADQLEEILIAHGNVNLVGKSFGVFKVDIDGVVYDFTLPRRDSKTGVKHQDFSISIDPSMTLREAALRRDFTINAIYYDPLRELISDYFNGIHHILNGILIHVSDDTFGDDALRVLRGMQLVSRFNLYSVNESTKSLCFVLSPQFHFISKDRIWSEWEKWANKSRTPSLGIKFLDDIFWLKFYQELHVLQNIIQDRRHHPEGDVYSHTLYVCDAMADICKRENITDARRTVLMFAALCHDLGKATTTKVEEDNSVTAHGHDVAGEEPTRSFLSKIGAPLYLIEDVVALVVTHMRHISFDGSKRAVRRLALKVNLSELALLVEADHSGRPPLEKGLPEKMKWILEVAASLNIKDSAPQPIIMGRHLIELGVAPGQKMGILLKLAFEMQLDGEFDSLESGIEWIKERI